MDRVYKLLRAEYNELVANESLLVESPFAETTRDGRGLRQVALGLTASKLIVASDDLRDDNRVFWCGKNVDPSIESLELKSLYPLEYLQLRVFREKKRQTLEARLYDGRAKYYELGGLERRMKNWNEWCVHVRRLIPRTERTTTITTTRRGSCNGWTRKHLYLGPDYEELWDERYYAPKSVVFASASIETVKNDLIGPPRASSSPSRRKNKVLHRVARFAEEVNDKCEHPLYIEFASPTSSSSSENNVIVQNNIHPNSHFQRGFGPWSINPGDRVSLQSRLTQSLASVRRQDAELRLPVSKRQLTRVAASLTNLNATSQISSKDTVLLFWTTDYWYKPRTTVEAYRRVRDHLSKLRKEQDDQRQRARYYRRSTTHDLRKHLKLGCRISLRDITSATLSRQLTLVERKLFTRITIGEIRNLVQRHDTRDATNFVAWVAFAHRITCLLESEILSVDRVEERSRIVTRLIRTAEKCIEYGNFQSACTIVAALRSPAVYRLKATWAYLKLHQRTKYKAMTKLSKLLSNVKTRQYHETWMTVESNNRSLMPSIADVITRLLGVRTDFTKQDDSPTKKSID